MHIQTGNLANNIRMNRLSKGMTQDDLSKMLGVSRMTICSWEAGSTEPSINSCFRMADIFGVTLDYLAGRHPKEVA